MIELRGISKAYRIKNGWNRVFDGFDLDIGPSDHIGILGRNGAGKSTLLRMIGGAEQPDRGSINRNMSVSWPIGFSGYVQTNISGRANTKFLARVYGCDPNDVCAYVKDFSDLGSFFEEPVRTYSTGMKGRLSFALSMAIDFDCLLIDEVLATGDAAFKEKCRITLEARRENSAFVIVNHGLKVIDRLCNKVLVLGLKEGPVLSDKVHETIKGYESLLKGEVVPLPDELMEA
ncbi:MAG: ABC transporter ATP-binding protein [Pseudomonadota bacterium]